MKDLIHVETPEGEIVKPSEIICKEEKDSSNNDGDDNAAGPKPNANPRANANIPEDAKGKPAEGTGSEVTDGEAG